MRVGAFVFFSLLLSGTWAENEIGELLDTARSRMRCFSDPKCLEKKGVERLLRVTNLKSAHDEELSMVLAHHFLHGDFSCTVQLPRMEIVEEEVMRAIETEDIPGILRIFKRILKEGGKKECIGTDGILKAMSLSSSYTSMQWVKSVLAVLMEHVMKGHCLEDSVPGDSLDNLFSRYGDACSPYLSAKGLKKMMQDIENSGGTHDHHHHNHDRSHHGGHNHEHECDHDHNHDHSDSYHKDHSHSSQDHNHDHSYNNLGNHNHFHHDDHKHHNHSDHDDHSHHNHADHDDYDHQNHSAHDHHEHPTPDDHYRQNHSDRYHENFNKYIDGKANNVEKDPSNDKNNNQEVKIHTIISVNENGNYSDLNTSENGTMVVESGVEYESTTTKTFSTATEAVFAARLSDPQPTREESNVITNILSSMITPSSSITSQCMSAESLVSRYGYDRTSISKSEFLSLCPVIVQQRVGDSCSEPYISLSAPSKAEVYGYGSASVFVLCLTSLSGVLLLPLMRQNARHYVTAGFQGLAFSTLASDALLHLMPEFLGLHSHDHSHEHSHVHEEASFPEPYAQLLLGFFATTYVLFMTEAVLCALSGKSKEQGGGHSHGHGHSHVHHISEPTLISVKSKSATQLTMSADQSCSSLDTEVIDMDAIKKPPNLMVSQPVICGLTSVALVVTLGDALHNFGDGLAIGAAFSANIRGGLSTAAAALCHELPHELGDFVVLLSTGLSYSRALCLNFLSGLTCFAGLYVGILVGDNEAARKWVMAVTASTFLYVALAEMVPELREHRHGSPFKMLLVKNIGIISGVVIMCIISVYEHQMP